MLYENSLNIRMTSLSLLPKLNIDLNHP